MPTITVPEISPRLIIPAISGLKSFAISVATAIFGFWDDDVGVWDDYRLSWGADIQYPSRRPSIGRIKLQTPKIK